MALWQSLGALTMLCMRDQSTLEHACLTRSASMIGSFFKSSISWLASVSFFSNRLYAGFLRY